MKENIQKKIIAKKTNELKRDTTTKNSIFFIVGIGASAGGLDALKQLFRNTPNDCGMAFVIIQHLDPNHKSLLSEIIARHTNLKVMEAKDGLKVNPNCIYTIPPNKDLKIQGGILKVISPGQPRFKRKVIDTFFNSLAIDQKDKAVGIILSGTGSEGTLGLKKIKAEGGITIVQDPKSAQFSDMPENAIGAKMADYILTPENIPNLLNKYSLKKNSFILKQNKENNFPTQNQLQKIFIIIRNKTGYDFSNYKTNTIIRRISKRTAINQINTIEEYIAFLQNNPNEIEKLYNDFLIGVTSFFRDKAVFNSVEKKVIPHLFKKCFDKQELRVWVCGCSTGEEAYSLAILFKENLEKNKQYLNVTIYASDIDKEAINFARNGIYPKNALTNITPSRLSRFFINKDEKFIVKKEIREMVVFADHNVIKDPPFSKMDMISCRNLLIYMNSDLQKKIISLFHYGLNTDGILLLGTSESIGDFTDYYSGFDPKLKIYKKQNEKINRKHNTEFELPYIQPNVTLTSPKATMSVRKKINISNLTEKILIDKYAPPSIIIDKNNNALYFSGDNMPFMKFQSGAASLNIIELIKKELKPKLENAIIKARSSKKEVKTGEIELDTTNNTQLVNILVKPVLTSEVDFGALMIIFEKKEKIKKVNLENKTTQNGSKKPKINEIEKELKITQEHLQNAIDELETSNEKLQTTNEEYQSSNEELQSTNEELETSKEELQSVNEELITVNNELSNKIELLSQSNDDLNNLLSSIEVATIFLDRDMKIKRFTPSATKIFNLIPSDIDRPVTHLSSNLEYKLMADDVKNSLKTLSIKTSDVKSNDGSWYHMRILPYRTEENIIEGVLMTFVDISKQKTIEEKLNKTNENLKMILENLPAIPFTCSLDKELRFYFIGSSSESIMGFMPEQFINKASFWSSRIHPNDKKKLLLAIANISKKGAIDIQFKWKCADGKYKQFINYMKYIKAENNNSAQIVGCWHKLI